MKQEPRLAIFSKYLQSTHARKCNVAFEWYCSTTYNLQSPTKDQTLVETSHFIRNKQQNKQIDVPLQKPGTLHAASNIVSTMEQMLIHVPRVYNVLGYYRLLRINYFKFSNYTAMHRGIQTKPHGCPTFSLAGHTHFQLQWIGYCLLLP